MARRHFAAAIEGRLVVWVSVLSLVEIAEGMHASRYAYERGFDAWMDQYFSHSQFRVVDLTPAMVRRSHSLYAIPERRDRLLVATALELGCPLITRDEAIRRSGWTATIW